MGRDFSKLQLVRAFRIAVLAIACVLLAQSKSTYGQVDEGSITQCGCHLGEHRSRDYP
jgi:hypothetical protein